MNVGIAVTKPPRGQRGEGNESVWWEQSKSKCEGGRRARGQVGTCGPSCRKHAAKKHSDYRAFSHHRQRAQSPGAGPQPSGLAASGGGTRPQPLPCGLGQLRLLPAGRQRRRAGPPARPCRSDSAAGQRHPRERGGVGSWCSWDRMRRHWHPAKTTKAVHAMAPPSTSPTEERMCEGGRGGVELCHIFNT